MGQRVRREKGKRKCVELKAPNKPLHSGHVDQLENYIRRAEKSLEDQGGYKAEIEVEGYLNGSKAEPSERGEQVELLRARIKKSRQLNGTFSI